METSEDNRVIIRQATAGDFDDWVDLYIAVAAEGSTFAFSEVRVGVAPAMIMVPGLHVVDHPASGPVGSSLVVVLVHGSLDRGTSFARVVRRLPDLHVVTYDRRGYHRSRPVAPLATTLEDHVADLVAVVDGRPSVLVGHSYGGDVALGAAAEAPDAVRAVGVYEPPLPWSDWWPRRASGR